MPAKRAFLFANGELHHPAQVAALIQPEDVLIAADGGLHHLNALGRTPRLLIGDLDSISPAQRAAAERQGIEIRQFPAGKDETDLELALDAAVSLGCTEIILTAALGGRVDHTLGNIFLLTRHRRSGVQVRLDDGKEELFIIHRTAEITGTPGDTISLIPLSPRVEGVYTHRLQYPLSNETLYRHRTRGISNRMQADSARVTTRRGLLLCVHTRNGNERK